MKNTKKLIVSALFIALCFVATMFLAFPLPTGYANLGDCFAFSAGFILGMPWGIAAAALGSALADLISGYAIYMPATFILKGLIAVVGALCARAVFKKKRKGFANILMTGGFSLAGELIMVAGYFIFECFALGVKEAALASVPANLGQAAVGLVASVIIVMILNKNRRLSTFISSELK